MFVTLLETSLLYYIVLQRIELEVLTSVDWGDTFSEFEMKLDHSESYLSRAVADLVKRGLIYTGRDDRRNRILPSDAHVIKLYQDFVRQHSHVNFPELLTGKNLKSVLLFRPAATGRRDRR